MEDWPAPRWGHPLPPATKYLTPRAFLWLVLILLVSGSGIYMAYRAARSSQAGLDVLQMPDHVVFPLSSEYMRDAQSIARSYQKDAKWIALSYQRFLPGGRRVKYHPLLTFCSPSEPDWGIEMDIEVNRSVFFRNTYHIQSLSPPDIRRIDCDAASLKGTTFTGAEALLRSQELIHRKYALDDEIWPVVLTLNRHPAEGYIWEIIYEPFSNYGGELVIAIDSFTGETVTGNNQQ